MTRCLHRASTSCARYGLPACSSIELLTIGGSLSDLPPDPQQAAAMWAMLDIGGVVPAQREANGSQRLAAQHATGEQTVERLVGYLGH